MHASRCCCITLPLRIAHSSGSAMHPILQLMFCWPGWSALLALQEKTIPTSSL